MAQNPLPYRPAQMLDNYQTELSGWHQFTSIRDNQELWLPVKQPKDPETPVGTQLARRLREVLTYEVLAAIDRRVKARDR
jgi:hypothetical protein